MASKGNYTDSELIRMQREAEARVRDMQSRARKVADSANQTNFVPPRSYRNNRNWSTGPNTPRRTPRSSQQPRQEAPPPQEPEIKQTQPETQATTSQHTEPAETSPPVTENKQTTILGDIMNALSLDEDYLLIIGLILILLNQRADTTLILALAYLLI